MFNEYIKDGHRIKATKRAYEVIYKTQGYVEVEEEKDTLTLLTVAELKELAKDAEIDGYNKMKKNELLAALKELESSTVKDDETTDELEDEESTPKEGE